MLAIKIALGESALFVGHFELFLISNADEKLVFQLHTLKPVDIVLREPDEEGELEVETVLRADPSEFELTEIHASPQGLMRIGPCCFEFKKFRNRGVKLAIEAPREIRIRRPSQHGCSLTAVQ